MSTFDLNNCKYNFASDKVDIIVLVYDKSGSMQQFVSAMKEANVAFYNDFTRFEEKGSIAIARADFDNGFSMTSFSDIENFSTNYYASGGTELYQAIEYAAENTIAYFKEILKRLNIRPKITFLVFSDGEDNGYHSSLYAQDYIKELNNMEATTVYVAFGSAIEAKTGEKLGFSCTKDITTVGELISTMGTQLSKSCKEQSRSLYSLKSAFFSKAAENAEDDVRDDISDEDFFFNV